MAHASTTTDHATTPGRSAASTRMLRLLPAAGLTYVAAWVVGLFVAPPAPKNDAPAAEIHSYFAGHGTASVFQALLVHGVAGIALAAMALGLAGAFPGHRSARLVAATGLAAATVSFGQVIFAVCAAYNPAGSSAATTADWFHAINYADTVKLMLIAAFAAVVTRADQRVNLCARWVRVLGQVLVPMLVLGGLAFLIDTGLLNL